MSDQLSTHPQQITPIVKALSKETKSKQILYPVINSDIDSNEIEFKKVPIVRNTSDIESSSNISSTSSSFTTSVDSSNCKTPKTSTDSLDETYTSPTSSPSLPTKHNNMLPTSSSSRSSSAIINIDKTNEKDLSINNISPPNRSPPKLNTITPSIDTNTEIKTNSSLSRCVSEESIDIIPGCLSKSTSSAEDVNINYKFKKPFNERQDDLVIIDEEEIKTNYKFKKPFNKRLDETLDLDNDLVIIDEEDSDHSMSDFTLSSDTNHYDSNLVSEADYSIVSGSEFTTNEHSTLNVQTETDESEMFFCYTNANSRATSAANSAANSRATSPTSSPATSPTMKRKLFTRRNNPVRDSKYNKEKFSIKRDKNTIDNEQNDPVKDSKYNKEKFSIKRDKNTIDNEQNDPVKDSKYNKEKFSIKRDKSNIDNEQNNKILKRNKRSLSNEPETAPPLILERKESRQDLFDDIERIILGDSNDKIQPLIKFQAQNNSPTHSPGSTPITSPVNSDDEDGNKNNKRITKVLTKAKSKLRSPKSSLSDADELISIRNKNRKSKLIPKLSPKSSIVDEEDSDEISRLGYRSNQTSPRSSVTINENENGFRFNKSSPRSSVINNEELNIINEELSNNDELITSEETSRSENTNRSENKVKDKKFKRSGSTIRHHVKVKKSDSTIRNRVNKDVNSDLYHNKINYVIDLIINHSGLNIIDDNSSFRVEEDKIKIIYKKFNRIHWNIFNYYFLTLNSGRIVLYSNCSDQNNKLYYLKINQVTSLFSLFEKLSISEILPDYIRECIDI